MGFKLNSEWKAVLKDIVSSEKFKSILREVDKQYRTNSVYPNQIEIFKAFNLTPPSKVKVVILGQDPYHEPNQANGLAFSVRPEVKIPPSLQNIFKELYSDLNIKRYDSDLSDWAKQGVLLLNSTLTVKKGAAASHKDIGWNWFTDEVIKVINDQSNNIVFILWGNFARNKKIYIDVTKHFIIESTHPSPLSAYNGFFGSKSFSKCNNYLKSKGIAEIAW